MLLLFIFVPSLSNRYSAGALWIRVALVIVLSVVAWLLNFRPRFAIAHYVALVALCALSVLAGVLAIMAVPSFGSVAVGFSPLPAALFALFLVYGFLRLPLGIGTALGWSFSIAVAVLVPSEIQGAGHIRVLTYLVAANAFGMLLCRSLETRERELFHQRRRAEAAQAELDRRARAAEEAHMEKTRLMAAVSHDLRQPMMAAVHHVSLLERRLQKRDLESAERQARALSDSVSVLAATLDHLLTAARYDSGTEPIMIESVELQPILGRLRETFESDAAARGIELRVRQPDRRLVVTTDATAFWRVLMNLVSNAIKFTDPHGRAGRGVVVRASLRDGVCRIDVADTGIGIAPEHLNAIWQPYFQVANSERSRVRGLGLGLFLVRRALDHLPNHRMQLRSRPGRGSRFSVLLPGLELGVPEFLFRGHDRIADSDLEQLRGAYVLVLEDDVHARRALEDLLSDWSVLFTSGASLVELLDVIDSQERLVDFIISDYRLAGTATGTDAIVAIREALGAQIPAVIVTGESATGPIRERLPVDTLMLQKPFEATALAIPLLEAVRSARRAERL
ncbi:MAG: hybrid sensor histidine kinase/response regulator [Burkholderiaceae bacterium]